MNTQSRIALLFLQWTQVRESPINLSLCANFQEAMAPPWFAPVQEQLNRMEANIMAVSALLIAVCMGLFQGARLSHAYFYSHKMQPTVMARSTHLWSSRLMMGLTPLPNLFAYPLSDANFISDKYSSIISPPLHQLLSLTVSRRPFAIVFSEGMAKMCPLATGLLPNADAWLKSPSDAERYDDDQSLKVGYSLHSSYKVIKQSCGIIRMRRRCSGHCHFCRSPRCFALCLP